MAPTADPGPIGLPRGPIPGARGTNVEKKPASVNP